jgi:acetyl-CoA decarbonylase/synthase complex subunit gamma
MAVSTTLTFWNILRRWGYRWGMGRMSAVVTPGLYQVGTPDEKSLVLVSANYRMSFDIVRSVLTGRSVWILVIDTKGINVWCAAGKGTFGTEELVKRVLQHKLGDYVSHRRLIVPQLGAPGVAAHEVKRQTGFLVQYGPVRARDLPAFLDTGQASAEMRRVTFNLGERLAVVPIELLPAFFPMVLIAAGIAWAAGWQTGAAFLCVGLLAPIAVPAFHNWLPGTWLSIKGIAWGVAGTVITGFAFGLEWFNLLMLFLSAGAVSAFIALNFTGATTYTSVNGVKLEMRRMLPFIISGAGVGLLGWIFMAVRRFWL